MSMLLASVYFSRYGLKSVFIMPPILFDQFLEEIDKIRNHGLKPHVLNYTPTKRERLFRDLKEERVDYDVLVMSKEIFKLHVEDLLLAKYSCLFFDECHTGLQSCDLKTPKKNHTTYGAVKLFSDIAKDGRLILSTGTPIPNELGGTYPIISLKTPEAYRNKRDFESSHITWRPITVRGPRGGRQINITDAKAYQNELVLQRNLMKQAVRATQMEVLNLHTPNVQEVPVRLHRPHMELYRRAVKEKLIEIGTELVDARNESMMRVLAQQLITNPNAFTSQKVDNAVIEMVQTLMDTTGVPKKKIFLFANFNDSVEILAKTFHKLRPAVIYGPNGPERNRAEIKRFQTDEKCSIGIANPVAGGVGLTLGHVCQTVIFVEPVSTPGQFEQASSRVILQGQTEPG